jgi:alpha-L-fucosidase
MTAMIRGVLCAGILTAVCMGEQPRQGAKPTSEQIAWHEMEIQMFLCLDPCTWQGREYDDHSTPLSEINPAKLDTDQWCRVAKSFGARQILFVAKHTGGFCWWQTATSDYGIRNTPYKGGKGDVLAELAESCRRCGLRLGVYVYPGDEQWGAGIGSGGRTKDPARQESYNKVLRQQWTEVLTRYGEVSEVWFDGSCVIEVGDILRKYAPKAMVFQGPHATLRWPGNEKGIAPYPTWQTVKKKDALTGVSTGRHSDPNGDVWLPMEMDTTLLDHKWFWGPNTDHMIKSVDQLMKIYYASVGRGCVLLLDATPDTTGLIPESHVRRYEEFGRAIRRIYENKKGKTSGRGQTLELRFDRPARVNHFIIQEDIRHGQIVRAYEVDGLVKGAWKKLIEGSSIGYRRIDVIDTVSVAGLRLRVTKAVDEPRIPSFGAYEVCEQGQATSGPRRGGAGWREVAGWRKVRPTSQWQTIDIDLTPYVRAPGQYEVELRRTGGGATLEVREAVAIMAGTAAPRLIAKLPRPHAWNINRTAQVAAGPEGRTGLRVVVRSNGSDPWSGALYIRGTE